MKKEKETGEGKERIQFITNFRFCLFLLSLPFLLFLLFLLLPILFPSFLLLFSEKIPADQNSTPYYGETSTFGVKASPCVINTALSLLVRFLLSLPPFLSLFHSLRFIFSY